MDSFNDYIELVLEKTRSNFNKIPSEYYMDYNVKRGLRNADGTGVLAGLTGVSEVHGYIIDEGVRTPIAGSLRYRGINVEEIVKHCVDEDRFGFEEVAFLLVFGFLPTKNHLDDFRKLLASRRNLPENFTEDMILKAPSVNIMNKLARSVLALYSYDEGNPDDIGIHNLLRQSFDLIARFPTMIAYAYATKCHYYDGTSLVLHNPNPELSTAENFLYMTRANHKFTHTEAKILDLCLMLHADHGGGNNSAFAIRVLSSSNTDTYSAIAAGIGSLKGPKHGGANEKCLNQMDEIKRNVENWQNDDEIYDYIKKIIAKEAGDGSGLVYGFGHAVYTLSDPRAEILRNCAADLSAQKGFEKEFTLYKKVEELVPKVFEEIKEVSTPMPVNVDFYSGFIYQMLGIPRALYTPIFAMARVVGWSAHRIEEVLTGGRIIRPAYKSVVKRDIYCPIDER